MVRFKPCKVLVIGDFVLDAYTTGIVKRISPEAPVPVLEVQKQEERPGGAGNVALSLKALGAQVTCLGRVGDDAAGRRLNALLDNALFVEENFITPVKTRIIAQSQQLLRIDQEKIAETHLAIEEIPHADVIAISDYGKGFITKELLERVMQTGIPVIVDPKGIDFTKYQGATILKPNLSEALLATGCSQLDLAAEKLLQIAKQVIVTRSEQGISLFDVSGRFDFPAKFHDVKDVTGAGDTVLAVLCMAVASGIDLKEAASLANLAAGLAIERVGCAQITLAELIQRANLSPVQ